MATYDAQIETLSDAMRHPDVIAEVFQAATEQSAILSLARRLPNMSTSTAKMTVTDSLPNAYFLSTPSSLKQTTNAAWKGKTLTAEELAVIVPIAEATLNDSNVDIWGQVKPLMVEAFGAAVDAAVIHGTNLPATWLTDTTGSSASLLAGALAASNTVTAGTGVDLYDDILGSSGIVALVEEQGYMVNGFVGPVSSRGALRHVRENRTDTGAGLPILVRDSNRNYTLDGEPCYFPKNGAIDAATIGLMCGDWSQIVYAVRQDITVKLFDQGVIQDGSGDIQYNLMQQDMVALRFVFRLAVQIANPVNRLATTEAARYPFAALVPAGS